jgi:hypothetical protein
MVILVFLVSVAVLVLDAFSLLLPALGILPPDLNQEGLNLRTTQIC